MRLNDKGKRAGIIPVTRSDVGSVDHYEEIALNRVEQFLKSKLDEEPPASKRALSKLGMLETAEAVLSRVANYHRSALDLGTRQGERDWERITDRLNG